MKQRAIAQMQLAAEPSYQPIELPKNSPTGFITAFFATITGFALIWHIWWLVAAGLIGAYAAFVVFAWRRESEFIVPAAEVARLDRERRQSRSQALLELTAERRAQSAPTVAAEIDPNRLGHEVSDVTRQRTRKN